MKNVLFLNWLVVGLSSAYYFLCKNQSSLQSPKENTQCSWSGVHPHFRCIYRCIKQREMPITGTIVTECSSRCIHASTQSFPRLLGYVNALQKCRMLRIRGNCVPFFKSLNAFIRYLRFLWMSVYFYLTRMKFLYINQEIQVVAFVKNAVRTKVCIIHYNNSPVRLTIIIVFVSSFIYILAQNSTSSTLRLQACT